MKLYRTLRAPVRFGTGAVLHLSREQVALRAHNIRVGGRNPLTGAIEVEAVEPIEFKAGELIWLPSAAMTRALEQMLEHVRDAEPAPVKPPAAAAAPAPGGSWYGLDAGAVGEVGPEVLVPSREAGKADDAGAAPGKTEPAAGESNAQVGQEPAPAVDTAGDKQPDAAPATSTDATGATGGAGKTEDTGKADGADPAPGKVEPKQPDAAAKSGGRSTLSLKGKAK